MYVILIWLSYFNVTKAVIDNAGGQVLFHNKHSNRHDSELYRLRFLYIYYDFYFYFTEYEHVNHLEIVLSVHDIILCSKCETLTN